MTWTAAQEYWGGSASIDTAVGLPLPLPHKPGGARLAVLNVTAASQSFTLPDARLLAVGGPHYTVGVLTNNADLVTHDTAAVVQGMVVGNLYELFLLDNSTEDGEWLSVSSAIDDLGDPLTLGREPWTLNISSTSNRQTHLRKRLDALGYDGVTPVALVVEVAAGVVLGAELAVPAVDTGAWPAGSTLLFINRGLISGRGGRGGAGGTTTNGNSGEAGGIAFLARISTAVVNYGTIQGGGGGGGGGQGSSGQAGGGGGGGSGHLAGQGGNAGGGGATTGAAGGLSSPGAGGTGVNAGGSGGAPGQAGSAGAGGTGGAGGAAGYSLYALDGVTINKVVTGTIYGSEFP